MLEAIFGSKSAERVLFYIFAREKGYATEIAKFYAADLSPIQKQLSRLERDGLLICRSVGRTKLYEFNPRYVFLSEVKALLAKAVTYLPEEVRESLTMYRARPRKSGKPLQTPTTENDAPPPPAPSSLRSTH